jgi:hypothetical protein
VNASASNDFESRSTLIQLAISTDVAGVLVELAATAAQPHAVLAQIQGALDAAK